jgi:biopolymer transport protein ExbD
MRLLVGLVVMVAGCMTPVMTFGEGKTAKQAQRETMADFTPARLVVNEKWAGEVASKRVRVWADTQYRAQNVKWQQTFEATIELTNVVLEPLFGLRLVADYRAWDRHAPAATLTDDLAALVAHDPGEDGVFAVIGLTSALPLVSATFDELGIANLHARHLVLRGYADLEERKLYADAFRDLLPAEREMALEQRRQHKTTVVLLHELGHNFGYEHDTVEDLIMSAGYSPKSVRFSPAARETITKGIDARLGRGDPAPLPVATPASTPAAPPPPVAAPPVTAAGPLVLHVTWTGDVFRGNRGVTDADVDTLLADAFATDRATEIVIKRAKKAPAATVQRIVKRATELGLVKVSITVY